MKKPKECIDGKAHLELNVNTSEKRVFVIVGPSVTGESYEQKVWCYVLDPPVGGMRRVGCRRTGGGSEHFENCHTFGSSFWLPTTSPEHAPPGNVNELIQVGWALSFKTRESEHTSPFGEIVREIWTPK